MTLLLIAEKIIESEDKSIFSYFKFGAIAEAIDSFYYNAFQPEIQCAIQFVENSSSGAQAVFESITAGVENRKQISFSEERIKQNILYIRRQLEEAIGSIRLTKKYMIFIDGIDVRPSNVDYEEYLDCVKGLLNAVWKINTGYLSTQLKNDTNVKVVLLVRPDILDAVRPQNLNNKIRDNGVLLDWRTSYNNFENSIICRFTDKILSVQQDADKLQLGEC